MPNGNGKSKSMLEAILSEPSDEEMVRLGQLPSGCLLNFETAFAYARKARIADTLEKKDEFLDIVIEYLGKVKAEVEAVK